MSIDERTETETIPGIVAAIRHSFQSGRTRPIEWRKRQLDGLLRVLEEGGEQLVAAMQADFGKPEVEAHATDIAFTVTEVKHIRKHMAKWAAPRKAKLRMKDRPGAGVIHPEPLGVSLVIAPWNYPVQLLVAPMAASLAAGNAIVAKPSELTPETSRVLSQLLRANLDPEAVAVIEGGVDVSTALLEERFDHIFFTGSTAVGKVVARAAAEHLTPMVLELGGKSPAIVTADADVDIAAHRIAWGKFLNAGQTCIAPDYVLVDRSRKDALVDALVSTIGEFYGADPSTSDDFTQIVNDRHVKRIEGLLDGHGGTVVCGGTVNAETRKLAPTVIVDPDPDSGLMQEEIFGPVLPIIVVDSVDEAIAFVNGRDKPLALYVFSKDGDDADAIVADTSSGGVCINHTLFHITPPDLPFGGVGPSGHGRYHGQSGFDELSNLKPVLTKPTKPEISLMYPPYTGFKTKVLKKMV
ncbi:aldehyde dehydrogenase family protein [Actinospongicola halichondriae]|uniref:aldehyde dehydrogenase family protein n=1 Tax=Actinospongicola halichondriae TaxID=3236844 RepID=UPI003D5CFF62